MKILITGSTGLLGEEVVKSISGKHTLYCVVRKLPQNKQKNIDYIECDLAEDLGLAILPKEVDVIIHLAQSPHYRLFPEKADDVFNVNCRSTAKLLDYAIKAKTKHFIFTSTGSVYEPYDKELVECTALKPNSFYANSKLIAEHLVDSYQNFFKISILRLFFLYGPHSQIQNTLINRLCHTIQKGEPVTIDGTDGGLLFVPTLTTDVANCINLIMEKELGGTINVAHHEPLRIKQAVDILANQLGTEPNIIYLPNKKAATIVPNLDNMHALLPEITTTPFSKGALSLFANI